MGLLDRHQRENESARGATETMSGSITSYGENREKGVRRKKLAGYWKAANDIRQSYQQAYAEKWRVNSEELDDESKNTRGSFPDVRSITHGDEKLVLFPSYAKRHIKVAPCPDSNHRDKTSSDSDSSENGDFWARECQKLEDDRAIVDVDVRGWLYCPHRGPMTRKNRLLVGIARQLSGIPAPKTSNSEQSADTSSSGPINQEYESSRDQEMIKKGTEQIVKRGADEEKAACQGRYSEKPTKEVSDAESIYASRSRSNTQPRTDSPATGNSHQQAWKVKSDISEADANTNLMARLKPFMTNPLVSAPITIFFYDQQTSISRSITTNEAGHFSMRISLNFVPTHFRVLASENLSATQEIKITEPKGVSLITDVDDTIKHTSIARGAREIFRNVFVRHLDDLTIDGVKEWYTTMYEMGVGFHYVSNSPWQLFPLLAEFFQKAGLPPGSYHLKQYSGMLLQGIFEPVSERKKGTLDKILRDFPERTFILIGDSGEADLEVYTDLVLAHPGRIIAIFIRDVTTPEPPTFFNSSMGPLDLDYRGGDATKSRHTFVDSQISPPVPPRLYASDTAAKQPGLPRRIILEVEPKKSDGPAMGRLIDFCDETKSLDVYKSHRCVAHRSESVVEAMVVPRRKFKLEKEGDQAPPCPPKPLALRGVANVPSLGESPASHKAAVPPPPKPRRTKATPNSSQDQTLTESLSLTSGESTDSYYANAKLKVSAVYNSLPEVRTYISARSFQGLGSETSSLSEKPPQPPPRRNTGSPSLSTPSKRLSWTSTDDSDDGHYRPNSHVPVDKKLELWRKRWKKSQAILESQGVPLKAWRVGQDVCLEALQIIERSMRDMGVEVYGEGKGKAKTAQSAENNAQRWKSL